MRTLKRLIVTNPIRYILKTVKGAKIAVSVSDKINKDYIPAIRVRRQGDAVENSIYYSGANTDVASEVRFANDNAVLNPLGVDSNLDGVSDSWLVFQDGGGAGITKVETIDDGAQKVEITDSTTTNSVGRMLRRAVVPGQVVDFSAMVKSDGNIKARVAISFWTGSGSGYITAVQTEATPADFTLMTASTTVPATANYAEFVIANKPPSIGNTGSVWAKDAVIKNSNCYGTTLYDHSGNGSNFVQTTAGYQPKAVTNGVIEDGLVFDGVDDLMTLANPLGASVTELTLELLFKVTEFNMPAAGKATAIISNWISYIIGSQKGFAFRHLHSTTDVNNWTFNICNGTADSGLVTPSISDAAFNALYQNKWLHVVCVYKASAYLRMYMQGVKIAASDITGYLTQCVLDTTIKLMRADVNSGFTKGNLELVKIYDRALSDNEVTKLYSYARKKYPRYNIG